MAHAESDYDLTGWYVQPPTAYLTLDGPPLQTLQQTLRYLGQQLLVVDGAVATTGGTKVEFFARDLRTVLRLAVNSNPHVLEIAGLTPVHIWRARSPVPHLLNMLRAGRFEPRQLLYHYASLASGMLADYADARIGQSDPKKLLQAAHAVLSARHVLEHVQLPPATLPTLLAQATDRALADILGVVLAARQEGAALKERDTLLLAPVYDALKADVGLLREAAGRVATGKPLSLEEGTTLWQTTLEEYYGADALGV